jgi:hypothetical protein
MFKKWEGFFLAAAFLSFVLANALYFGWIEGGTREAGIFVGHWVTSIMVALTYLRVSTHAHETKAGSREYEPPAKTDLDSKWYDGSTGDSTVAGLVRDSDQVSSSTSRAILERDAFR